MERVRYDSLRKGTYIWEKSVQTGFITCLHPTAAAGGFPIGFNNRKG